MQVSFRGSAQFNPRMQQYCGPFADETDFGAHLDAFSSDHSRSSGRAAATAPRSLVRWALACASTQIEPLLVTLLVPNCSKLCIYKLAKPPQHHASPLSTAQIALGPHIVDRGQVGRARPCKSGTDIIMVGNWRSYDTY